MMMVSGKTALYFNMFEGSARKAGEEERGGSTDEQCGFITIDRGD